MQLSINSNKNTLTAVIIDKLLDECPYCHKGIEPNYLGGFRNFEKDVVHLNFFCPRLNCGGYFIGEYQGSFNSEFYLTKSLLGYPIQKNFSETIINISPDFIQIFIQSATAEQNGLDQICGVGFRKALEFLIKDYIIHKNSELKERVEKLLLGRCINDYITNDKIKEIAKRAVWIGNDETHYVRKWVNKNIQDLKMLIELTVHWIETEDLTEKMIASMPE